MGLPKIGWRYIKEDGATVFNVFLGGEGGGGASFINLKLIEVKKVIEQTKILTINKSTI